MGRVMFYWWFVNCDVIKLEVVVDVDEALDMRLLICVAWEPGLPRR